jgi:hypothetical protein
MENDKLDLEKEKLSLEIAKLKVHWLRNLEFWKVTIPTIAILFSLYFTFGKGLLDSQKEKLEIQKELLKLEILTFENQKKELTISIATSTEELDRTNEKIFQQRLISDSLNRQVKAFQNKLSDQEKRFSESSGKLNRDKSFFMNELAKMAARERSNSTKITIVYDSLKRTRENFLVTKTELQYYKKKITLTDAEQSDLSRIKLNKQRELHNAEIKRLEESIKRSDNNMKKLKGMYDTLTNEEAVRLLELRFLTRDTSKFK